MKLITWHDQINKHNFGLGYYSRNLGKCKFSVRNRSRPEGSIAEAHIREECVAF